MEVRALPALSDNYIYLLLDGDKAAVVDPGVPDVVIEALEAEGRGLDLILNTHHHGDHIAGNEALKARYGAYLIGPAAEAGRISGMDRQVAAGDSVEFAGKTASVIETPGHTTGHIAFHFASEAALFCGDTLFSLGCGRMFEGSPQQFWDSLKKLRALPEETQVYCGHEYTASNARFAVSIDPDNTTLAERSNDVERLRAAGQPTIPSRLGEEIAANPFLRADDPGLQAALGLSGQDPVTVFADIRSRKDRF